MELHTGTPRWGREGPRVSQAGPRALLHLPTQAGRGTPAPVCLPGIVRRNRFAMKLRFAGHQGLSLRFRNLEFDLMNHPASVSFNVKAGGCHPGSASSGWPRGAGMQPTNTRSVRAASAPLPRPGLITRLRPLPSLVTERSPRGRAAPQGRGARPRARGSHSPARHVPGGDDPAVAGRSVCSGQQGLERCPGCLHGRAEPPCQNLL